MKGLLATIIPAVAVATAGHAATTNFTDNFDSGASASWGNELGSWSAANGVYAAANPGNAPAAISTLPFKLADLSVDFDINDVTDGGIWLRSALAPGTALGIKGIALNLKVLDGPSRVYWHVVNDGSDWGQPLNVAPLDYGSSPHVHIEVSGNVYSAFINGSTIAATTLTNNTFGSGRVALYANSSQSFDNFALSGTAATGGSTVVSITAPAVEIRWHSQIGKRYQVQWAPRRPWNPYLAGVATSNSPSWVNIGEVQQGTGNTMTYFETIRRTPGFYRVQALP